MCIFVSESETVPSHTHRAAPFGMGTPESARQFGSATDKRVSFRAGQSWDGAINVAPWSERIHVDIARKVPQLCLFYRPQWRSVPTR